MPAKATAGPPAQGNVAQQMAPQPPPMPHPPRDHQHLVDIPCTYLYDRNGWVDFKRALNECGLVWNIPDWMTTILHGGPEWKNAASKGTDLSQYFPIAEKKTALDGTHSKNSVLGGKLVELLGLPKNMGDYIRPQLQFCCLATVEFEDEKRLPARQKLWQWLVRSLRGTRTTPGAYHYLVDEVQPYDISFLFKRLVDVLEQVTICSLDDELECVIKMDY